MQHHHRARRVVTQIGTIAAAITLLIGSAAAQLSPGLHPLSFNFGGDLRVYDLHVPASYDGSTPMPLVVDFHGHGSNRAQQRLVSGFQALSETENFLVAYPQGLFNSWNAGFCCGGAVANNIDDVGFARALVDEIGTVARIDRRRVYATGISNGGFMTHRLACEAADLFAAFAPVAGFVGIPTSSCNPSRPVPLQMFMGITDVTVPYSSAVPTFNFWKSKDSCVGAVPDETNTSNLGNCQTYTNCLDDVEVSLCSVVASPLFGGHVVYINSDYDVDQVTWEFMSRYTLPSGIGNFKCYKAKDLKSPKFVATTVQLADQFGVNDGLFDVSKPTMLCNPVDINGAGIDNGIDHLACYKIKGAKIAPENRPSVDVQNALGASQLQATKPSLLCVPSSKTVLP